MSGNGGVPDMSIGSSSFYSTPAPMEEDLPDLHGGAAFGGVGTASQSVRPSLKIKPMPLKVKVKSKGSKGKSNGISTAAAAAAAAMGGGGGVKLYSCTLCQARFDKVSALNKHIRSHSNDVE